VYFANASPKCPSLVLKKRSGDTGYASDEERDECLYRGAAALDALAALPHGPTGSTSDSARSNADADNSWMDEYRASAFAR
jgi:hypothetical protein